MTKTAKEVIGQAQNILRRELGFTPARADIQLYEYGGQYIGELGVRFFYADYILFRVKGGNYEYRYHKGSFEVSKIGG